MEKIFCHICDEELANSIENLPDKCPICDTRKYEIIQEIKSLEEEEKTPQIEIIESIAQTSEEVSSEPQVVINNEVVVTHPQDDSLSTNNEYEEHSITENSGIEESTVEAFHNDVSAVVVEEQDPISDIVCYDDESDDQIIFKENSSSIDESLFYDDSPDVVFDDEPDVVFKEAKKKENKVPQKTGASALEVLPDKETGFSKGSYLILYSAEKKAIAYFKIDNVGSIIIGRSSERGSPNDIDLTMAWKHTYKNRADSSQAFQEKMKMVKGISRKHALVRYDKAKKSYVFFHLSDKNYTIVKTAQGEKRERPPKNRNPVYLEPGSLISMGNHKNYIIMRFKEIK